MYYINLDKKLEYIFSLTAVYVLNPKYLISNDNVVPLTTKVQTATPDM